MSEKLLRLRYPATCSSCGGALAKGTEASWNRETKTATCTTCLDASDVATAAVADAIERGEASGSAAREWHRSHDRREQAIRSRYGRLSGVVLALSDDPHSTAAWAHGANGERALGQLLDPLRNEGLAVLHDRRIPHSKANIDHLVVAPWGVFVVDAKNYKGRVETRDRGGFFSTDYRLYLGGRDKTALVAGMTKQAQAVRAALDGEDASVQICKTICFVDADWSQVARPIELEGVHVLWPHALGKLIRTEGSPSREEIARIERKLALALPAA
jgi:Nuclease-related domain